MSRQRCLTLGASVLIALFAPPAVAVAQGRLTLPPGAVSVVGAFADHRVDTGLGLERAFGPMFGAQLDVEPDPRFGVSLRALGGTLDAKLPGSETRSVGELALTSRLDVLSWFRGTVSAVGRSYSGALARQHWSELSLGGEGHAPLIDGILDASLGLSLAPVVRVTGRQGPDLAVAGSARLRHSGERLDLSLGYSLERYDFPVVEGTRRVEEISMLTLRAGLRFGRRPPASAQ
jgi:hypothetical protein